MKKQMLILFAGFVVLSTACSKYEEGPNVSLRSKVARVSNEWKVAYAYDHIDKMETTSDFSGETWVFTKEGAFMEKSSGVVEKTGKWSFVNNKEEISINFPSDQDRYTILRLKEKEMWLKDKEEEIHLIAH